MSPIRVPVIKDPRELKQASQPLCFFDDSFLEWWAAKFSSKNNLFPRMFDKSACHPPEKIARISASEVMEPKA